MKPILIAILLALVTTSCVKNQPTLYMIGDSTMANKTNLNYPERGWGQLLPTFFDSTFVIENHSKNGRSTRSFIYENRWDSVYNKLKPGDFVVIQFGHNDDVITKSKTYTTHQEYVYNLSKYVKETLAKEAQPILCSPIIRRNYVDGELRPTHGEYPQKVKEVAEKFGVPYIDMTLLSREHVLKLGEEASKKLYLHLPSKIDNTHFSEKGAITMSQLFVNEIQKQNLNLANYLKNDE